MSSVMQAEVVPVEAAEAVAAERSGAGAEQEPRIVMWGKKSHECDYNTASRSHLYGTALHASEENRKRYRPMLDFCVQVAIDQVAHGRKFIIEKSCHPCCGGPSASLT